MTEVNRRFDLLGELGGTKLWGPGVDPYRQPLETPEARQSWSRVTFGGEVVADLVRGLREHRTAVARRFPRKLEAIPFVIGSTYLFTSHDVVDALLTGHAEDGYPFATHCCILINKVRVRSAPMRLAAQGTPFPKERMPGLTSYMAREPDGRTPVIGPGTPLDDPPLGPVRLVGWRKDGNRALPLLHAKVAVCGAIHWQDVEGGTIEVTEPMSTWMGSANWTAGARQHLEIGAWSHDPALANGVLDWLSKVIAISEPLDSQSEDADPELVLAEWDNAAFVEAMEAMEAAEAELAELERESDG